MVQENLYGVLTSTNPFNPQEEYYSVFGFIDNRSAAAWLGYYKEKGVTSEILDETELKEVVEEIELYDVPVLYTTKNTEFVQINTDSHERLTLSRFVRTNHPGIDSFIESLNRIDNLNFEVVTTEDEIYEGHIGGHLDDDEIERQKEVNNVTFKKIIAEIREVDDTLELLEEKYHDIINSIIEDTTFNPCVLGTSNLLELRDKIHQFSKELPIKLDGEIRKSMIELVKLVAEVDLLNIKIRRLSRLVGSENYGEATLTHKSSIHGDSAVARFNYTPDGLTTAEDRLLELESFAEFQLNLHNHPDEPEPDIYAETMEIYNNIMAEVINNPYA